MTIRFRNLSFAAYSRIVTVLYIAIGVALALTVGIEWAGIVVAVWAIDTIATIKVRHINPITALFRR